MRRYKKIFRSEFSKGSYSLVPIRDEDKYHIMKWRNEQIGILRQQQPLTAEQQENYFKTVIDALFEQEYPKQFIFSFLENGKLIGYGGLVHIDWDKKSAEISFLTETARNKSTETFISDWVSYLSLLKPIAGDHLNLGRIFTYAYDLRPNLYVALEQAGFMETERMKDHVDIDGELKDVVIHSFFMPRLSMETASEKDTDLYFEWANDPEVRRLSFQQDKIIYENHVSWFNKKLSDPAFRFYLFRNEKQEAAGQVRINDSGDEIIIGISIDAKHRGYGYGSKMLVMACADYFERAQVQSITAYIKEENAASLAIFKKAGFRETASLQMHGADTKQLKLNNE